MTLKSGGILAGVALALLLGVYFSGKSAGREAEQANTAQIVAARANHVADSVKASLLAQFDSAAKATAKRIADADAKTNAAARQTNQALAAGNKASEDAHKLLADSSATIGQLRGSLATTAQLLDSLGVVIQVERQANNEARQARDSSHAQEIRLLRGGFTVAIDAKDEAARAVGKSFAASLRQAESHGVRVGLVRGGVGATALLALLVYALNQ